LGQRLTTNAAGEFVLEHLIPGRKFVVMGFSKGMYFKPPEAARRKGYAAESGKTIDLGTIELPGDE
jgi:hypothetical protein